MRFEHLRLAWRTSGVAGGTRRPSTPLRWRRSPRCRRCPAATTTRRPRRVPYDVDRDGFVLGEGRRRVLETYEHARGPRRPDLRRVSGGRWRHADSYHITAPDPEGSAPHARCARRSRLPAHRTPTSARQRARHDDPDGRHRGVQGPAPRLRRSLDEIAVTATKASTGHLLGGAGAIEAMFTCSRCASAGAAHDQPHDAGPGDPARVSLRATARRRSGARDQQLVRLRRAQRRRRFRTA